MSDLAILRSSFSSAADEVGGKRPVVFDILGPDWETSILPDDLKMVLHHNPQSLSIKYQRVVTRIQTRGGFVEQHWGDGPQSIEMEVLSGGFMRLYSGLSSITSTKYGGGRRETIAYDKYLDLLAMFHNGGSVFDSKGNIVFQGIIKITFDGGVFLGWFNTFTVTEAADKPYQFSLSASFEVHKEVQVWRTTLSTPTTTSSSSSEQSELLAGQPFIPDNLS